MRKLRKVLAIVLTLSLVLSMLNVSAFAAAADSSQQIVKQGGTKLYNEEGTEVSGSKIGDNGSVVALSKTISGTDTENYFDITLEVETLLQKKYVTTRPDSAVVLTFDLSGTMGRNKMGTKSYIQVAKDNALSFIENYAAAAGSTTSKRMLAIAGFDTDARVVMDWVDVNPNTNKDYLGDIKNVFDKYLYVKECRCNSSDPDVCSGTNYSKFYGNHNCTNFDAGLMLTRNLLGQISGIDNTYAVILSDGAPTVTSNNSTIVGTIESTFWYGQGYANAKSGGGWTHPEEVKNNLTYLSQIAALAEVFMIGTGDTMNEKLFKEAYDNKLDKQFETIAPSINKSMTTGDWMNALASAVNGTYASAHADNANAVKDAYESIIVDIKEDITNEYPDSASIGWNVTDPMGKDYIEFVEFIDSEIEDDEVSLSNNTINWNLLNSKDEDSSETKSLYKIKYRVRLTNEMSDFTDGSDYTTNEETTLKYEVVDIDNNSSSGEIIATFPIPQVEGYLQSLSFVKQDDAGNAVKGAAFTLTHTDGCGVAVAAQTEVSGEDGTVLFENIPSGHSYTLVETSAPDNYIASSAKSTVTVAYDVLTESGDLVQDGNVAVNQALVDISGSKSWNDEADRDGKRPESITINLLANGTEVAEQTVTANDHWEYTFNNVPKYENGVEIVYTITEDEVAGYKTKVKGYDVTNSYEPERISISGEKSWNDDNDRDGVRAENITIILKANDKEVERKTVTAEDNWKYTFENLYKYEGGTEIDYTIDEVNVDGYDKAVDGYNVINTHKPETTEVSGEKTWADADDQDGKRPESIIINLLADGTEVAEQTVTADTQWTYRFTDLPKYRDGGVEIVYSITEDEVEGYETEVNGYDVTNSYIPETTEVSGSKTWADADDQDGKRPESIIINLLADGTEVAEQTVTADTQWTYGFTDLPKYRDGGVEIVYSITEDEVEGYETEVNGYNVTNSYVPETTEVSGAKTWNDADDQDGKRPESIIINLLADGTEVAEQTVTEEDNWTYTFTNLPKYRDGGVEIVYTITEDAVEGYETEVNGYDVTNTHIPEQTAVSGEKIWNDADNQDGKRTESIIIRLYADGVEVKSKVVTAEEGWTYTFDHLDKYVEGKEIEYTITEDEVAGYQTIYSEENYNVTNVYVPQTVAVIGEKTWNDADNQDGVRPESITIRLYADGAEVESKMVTEADGWTFAFENLPKYRDGGVEIVYTITEDTVEGYEALVEGYNVVNTHEVAKTDVSVTKVWNDNNNELGVRPESIEVRLYANGTGTGKAVVLSEANGWCAEFNDLDMYKNGELIKYEVVEVKVEGYEAVVTAEGYDFTITNTVKVLPPDEPVIEEPKEEPQELPEDENIIDEPEDEQVEEPEAPKQELPEDENIIEEEKAPDTGDLTPISELIVVMLAALVSLFVLKRKEN